MKANYQTSGERCSKQLFFGACYPRTSGGAVAQIMFMRKAGVPVAKATVVVFVRTIMSITFFDFAGAVCSA